MSARRKGAGKPCPHDLFIAGESIDLVGPDERAIEEGGWSTWFNDPQTTAYLDQGLYPNSRLSQHEYLVRLNQPGSGRLLTLIWAKAPGKLVGVASLSNINWQHRRCEPAVVIGERGVGADALFYGLEAKARLTEHAFEVMGMERVGGGQAWPLLEWQRFQVLFGFRPEGVARRAFRKGQEVHDVMLTAATRDDYLRVKEARGGAYWPGRAALLELMRRTPKEPLVERVAEAIDREVEAYLKDVTLNVPDPADG